MRVLFLFGASAFLTLAIIGTEMNAARDHLQNKDVFWLFAVVCLFAAAASRK